LHWRPREAETMAKKALVHSAADYLPERLTLPALRQAASGCQGCHLYRNATQTVFGEGAAGSLVMIVGEQPGDSEDRTGRPFVGPAGALLDGVLDDVSIDRRLVYVTNAVKHFKWKAMPGQKRRMHDKPRSHEIAACRPWLLAEIQTVQPKLLVAMGATAAQSLLGSAFRITKERGRVFPTEWAPLTLATYHPSAILRAPDSEARARMRSEFAEDLRGAAAALQAAQTKN
jgi:uracil-DNA glycosylase